ncbi:MAG: peptidoglycan DD-metalloendopeptidase family protein [Candidatus Uhrbacteria bacterium]
MKKTAITLAIRIMDGLFAVGRGGCCIGRALAAGAVSSGVFIVRGVVPTYRSWRLLRRFVARTEFAGLERLIAFLANRYAAHAVFIVIALAFAAQTIHARERGGFFGEQRPLLAAFLGNAEELDATGGDEGEEIVLGPSVSSNRPTFRAASVGLQPTVLGAEIFAFPTSSAGFAVVQPILTDAAVVDTERAAIREYTVETGDTISTIAEKFGLNVSTVLWANKLQSWSVIQPGNRLIILPTDGVSHTVKRGETLESIAKRYGADAEEVLEFNRLIEADDLEIGDILIVPGGRPPAVIAPPAPPVIRRQPSLPLPSIAGKLLWPSAGGYRISQYFTWRHHGLDVAISKGTEIFASESGMVISAGWLSGYGNQVTIDHGNGLKTRYAHSSKLLVVKGQTVTRGQVIALVGSTGRSTGSHIHYEVFANGTRVNPFQYLR